MWLPSRGLTWSVLVLGLVLAGAGLAAWLLERGDSAGGDAFTAAELVALRFPDEWEKAPVRGPAALLAMARTAAPRAGNPPDGPMQPLTRMSAEDFAGALAALDRARAARSPPNAILNDSQIASIKSRLALTPEQEKHWPPMEGALRAMAWKQTGGRNGPVVDPEAAQRLKQAADGFLGLLTERQKRDIRLLANVAGLRLNF